MLGSIIVFYLMGYEAPAIAILSGLSGSESWEYVINSLFKIFTDPVFLGAIGFTAFTTLITSSGNYAVHYIVPIMLLVILANVFFLPTSFIMDAELPVEIKTIAMVYLNSLLMLGAVEFVRGGSI